MAHGSELQTQGMRWQMLPGLMNGGFDPDCLFGGDGLRLTEWLASGQAGVLKKGQGRLVYRVVLSGLDFIVKWYSGGGRRIRNLVQASEARKEFELAQAVIARRVATAEPLAVGEATSGASCLLLRTLADVQPLDTFLEWTLPERGPVEAARLRWQLAARLGEFVARMHDGGLRHPDLHPGNLLVDATGQDPRLCLVDLHGVCLGKPLNWSESRANLVVLNRWFMLRVSRPDRLRFWVAYRRTRRAAGWEDEIAQPVEGGEAKHKAGGDPVTQQAVRELERAAP